MKILKIFGAVVAVHFVAFVLLFTTPGCSTTAKQPVAASTMEPTGTAPSITVPTADSGPAMTAAPMSGSDSTISFDPNAAAINAPRYSPTRPNTAAASAVKAQPVSDVTPATTYVVKNGDSLSTIAKKNKVAIKEITAANHLTSESKLKLGQKLIIPGKAASATMSSTGPMTGKPEMSKSSDLAATSPSADTPAPKSSGASVTHVVKPGESLGSIAKKYQVKQGDIAVANNITNPALIRAGMSLTIPGWTAPKSAKSGASSGSSSARAEPTPTPLAPPPGQDLDAGLKPSSSTEIPVIKIDDGSSAPATKSP